MTYLYIRVDFASGASLGPSRTAILEGIDRYGSISASARSVGLTYRQVWSTVQLMNRIFPKPLVVTRAAGPKGGAALTPLGKKLVARFRALEHDAGTALLAHTRALKRLLGEDANTAAPVPRWARIADGAAAKPIPRSTRKPRQ